MKRVRVQSQDSVASNATGRSHSEVDPYKSTNPLVNPFYSPDIVCIAPSMYPDLKDPRFQCALTTARAAGRARVPLLFCDDSPPQVREIVKTNLVAAGNGYVRVVPLREPGRKGHAIREALRTVIAWRHNDDETTKNEKRWTVVFLEAEKADMIEHVEACARPILANDADIVTPKRDNELFRTTYAIEQYHSESFGNATLDLIFRESAARPEDANISLDWLFGPIVWEGGSVSKRYLECDAAMWDAQVVPAVQAYFLDAARWASVRIPYRHLPAQKLQEEGSRELCEKRLMQLQLMITRLGAAFRSKGKRPVVVVTGASGNLGTKIAAHLVATRGGSHRIILMDVLPVDKQKAGALFSTTLEHQVEWLQCDLLKYDAKGWVARLAGAALVFHLAAKNPFPEATSSDAFDSMRITSNVLEACAAGQVGRVVYTSSNHVVGRLRETTGEPISPHATPNFGTKYEIDGVFMDSTLYASAKVAGEAQCQAMVDSGRLASCVVVRVGWCQPGENRVESMTWTGTPTMAPPSEATSESTAKNPEDTPAAVLAWYQAMHLRNVDLRSIVDRCVDAKDVPAFARINGVSENPGKRWAVQPNDLKYEPAPPEST